MNVTVFHLFDKLTNNVTQESWWVLILPPQNWGKTFHLRFQIEFWKHKENIKQVRSDIAILEHMFKKHCFTLVSTNFQGTCINMVAKSLIKFFVCCFLSFFLSNMIRNNCRTMPSLLDYSAMLNYDSCGSILSDFLESFFNWKRNIY